MTTDPETPTHQLRKAVPNYVDTLVRVRYAETDQMGVVYYANYYIYAEIGRVEYMRERGVNYKQMEIEDDSYIFVAESKCRYIRSAKYDDPLRIRTRIGKFNRRTIRFAFEIFQDESGDLLAIGETLHVVCDSHGKPKSLPDKYRKYFGGKRNGSSLIIGDIRGEAPKPLPQAGLAIVQKARLNEAIRGLP